GRTLAPRRLLSGRRRPAPANDSADKPAAGEDPSQGNAPLQPEVSVSPFGDNPPPLRQPRWKRMLLFWRPDAS
ncbi:MAG TPA: hypothetical protein VGY53_04090, partial [Isosphaeraceae bacterium]|nr:hypothetical protein [Isosphaeraceae bacterium]